MCSLYQSPSSGVCLKISQTEYKVNEIIIATGSKPKELKGLEFDGKFILNSDDVLKRQVVYGRGKKDVSGFAFYRYDSFQVTTSKKEIDNLIPILKTK